MERIVLIKTWNKMEKEFGLNFIGSIRCESRFIKVMEERLPPHRTIKIDIDYNGNYCWRTIDGCAFSISEDMIESEIKKE